MVSNDDPQEERCCDPLVMSAMETKSGSHGNKKFCVSSIYHSGARAVQRCLDSGLSSKWRSPVVNSIDSSSRLLDSSPYPGYVTLGKSHTVFVLQYSLLKMETVLIL